MIIKGRTYHSSHYVLWIFSRLQNIYQSRKIYRLREQTRSIIWATDGEKFPPQMYMNDRECGIKTIDHWYFIFDDVYESRKQVTGINSGRKGTCGLSAKALGHVITLRFNKYSFIFPWTSKTWGTNNLGLIVTSPQPYWYSTNISSSNFANNFLALSDSPVWATMSNNPSNFFTWYRKSQHM